MDDTTRFVLQGIIAAAHDAIIAIDEAGRITSWNRAAERIFGYPEEAALGRNVHELLAPPPLREAGYAGFETFRRTGQGPILGTTRELSALRRDGTEFPVELSVSVFTLNGRHHTVGIVRDISLRKQAEHALAEAEARFRSLVEQSLVGVYIIQDGRFRYVNPRLAEIFGYGRDEMIGMGNLDVTAPEDRERAVENILNRLVRGVSGINYAFGGLRKDGMPIYVEVFGSRTEIDGRPAVIGTLLDITERRRAEEAIRRSEGVYRTLVDNIDLGITLMDRDYNIVMANAALGRLFGKPVSEFVGKNCFAEYEKRDAICVHCPGTVAMRDNRPTDVVTQGVRDDGSRFWVRNRAFPFHGPDGRVAGFIEVVQDITSQKTSEEELLLAAKVFASTAEGIVITDSAGRIVKVNRAFTEITGYSEGEVAGRNPRLLKSGRHDREFYMELWETLRQAGRWSGEIWNRRKGGEVYPEWLSITAVRGERGEVANYVGIFSDISQHKQTESVIEHLSQYDPLTDLPNRVLLQDRLNQAMESAARGGRRVGMLTIDLDRFKNINDTLGHQVGDLLLEGAAQRLKECLRNVDTVSRLGGDEFGVVLAELTQPQDAALVATKILKSLADPLRVQEQEFVLTASVGISVYPGDGEDFRTLTKNSEIAMYHAKAEGRNNYQFFTPEMNALALERMTLEHGMRRALERSEFLLHYQPQVDLRSGRIEGVEALVRWKHPEWGLVAPARFIPLAEETGLILPLGEWVMAEACRQARAWELETGHAVRMSVNLSTVQFRQQNLVQRVTEILAQAGLAPNLLELEVTESMLAQRPEAAVATLSALKRLGIRLSVDDFGTGYSSLNYLKRFPLDKLKIDRSFIQDIPADPNDAAITQAVIALARSLQYRVVAEGVETLEQLAFLAQYGCDGIQGYYFSRPLPAEDLAELLKSGRRLEFPQ